MKRVLTTGQIAKVCQVSPRIVAKWIDGGDLKGYRLPNSQARRVPRENLLKFLKAHGMPLGDLEREVCHKVLVIGADQSLQSLLREHILGVDLFRLEIAESAFAGGIQITEFQPDCILVDLAIGRIDAGHIAQMMRRIPHHRYTMLIALTDGEVPPDSLASLGYVETAPRPTDGAKFAVWLRRLLTQEKTQGYRP